MRSFPYHLVAVSLLIVAALLPGAFLRGEVLGQAALLRDYQPWRSSPVADGQAGNPLLTDPVLVFQPLLTHTVAAVRENRLPIWNPSLYGGQPFLASFQTAVFSPYTAIAFVVPLPYATVWMAIAPLLVGAAGMWCYLRALGLTASAAWFGGLAYLLNTFAWVWLEHPLPAVACWLPWTLLAIDRLVARRSGRTIGALAILVALTILAGHPETAAKVLGVAVVYAAVAAWQAGSRHTGFLGLAFVAGVLLTAVQVLPFIEYLSQSQALQARAAITTNRLFLPAATLVTGLVPGFWGTPVDGTYVTHVNRFGFPANYAEQALYAGMVALILAPAGLVVRRHDWRPAFFGVTAILSLAVMFGLPGLLDVASHLPLVRVMFLSRFGLIVIVACIVLAAYVVDALTNGTSAEPDDRFAMRVVNRTVAATSLIVALLIALAWLLHRDAAPSVPLDATARAIGIALAFIGVTVILVRLRIGGLASARAFGVLACVAITADLFVAARGFHPTTPAAHVYPATPELDLLTQDRGLFRVYGWGTALPPNTAMAYGLSDARGWDGMNPYRYTRLLDLGYLRQSADPLRHLANPTLLDLLNVKYVLLESELALPPDRYKRIPGSRAPLYENRHQSPRAFLVDRYRVLDEPAMLRTLHEGSADLSREVLLEEELPEAERPVVAPEDAARDVRVTHYRDTFVELRVRTTTAAILVMSDAHYPGWSATVDNVPAPIRRADYALRAVSVQAGDHVVRFHYRPWSLTVGAIISSLTACLVLAAALRSRAS
ncbi:MAG TPA: YfhO family protein [Luteitalea sp.]|nr:YfhO family protein [Luteitalea sp.]